MNKKKAVGLLLGTLLAMGMLAGCGSEDQSADSDSGAAKEFLNVSYDPTRELYAEFNEKFKPEWKGQSGEDISARELSVQLGQPLSSTYRHLDRKSVV